MRPEIKINGQFPDGLRITIEKIEVLVDDNKQVSEFLDLFDAFMIQINEKITKPAQEEIAQMLRDAQDGKYTDLCLSKGQ